MARMIRSLPAFIRGIRAIRGQKNPDGLQEDEQVHHGAS
jgi:hypothetical protein